MATSGTHEACSIEATLDVIGDRWTLLVLRDLFRGVRRFSDLVDDLGIAKNLLSDRLKRLVEHGVVEKVAYQERPARYDYRLTAKGADLSPALIALMKWGDEWYADGNPPVVLVHEACGTPLEQHVSCPTCNEAVTPGKVRSQAGSLAHPPIEAGSVSP
ncbi:MAG: helix-turn-helix domain-containing protein [Acidimicrobiales bacterium]